MSLEGQQIDRYRIVRLLGSGGMGDVYLAEDARIEQQVAIKVIRAEVSAQSNQDAVRLFQREAKAIARLDHPYILPLYDYGEEQIGNMTIIYLVMPYRQEGSLTDWLREHSQAGTLAPQEAMHFIGQAASALQHAHDRQIIHQDVKPSNFLLRSRQETPMRPDLLLADFGIARLATATASASQSIRGTPTYMSPEQWAGHPVASTDQYALAVMAYELLAGHPPFQGPAMSLMYLHTTTPPPPPSSVNPRLSRDLDAVLLHALAKRPEQRFASISAFANAFQQATIPMPTPVNSGDIRAVLAISTVEAQKGTTRTLTLPRGRQVTVNVPAGVRDGQIVRLDGQGETPSAGGPAGALILSILVKTTEEPSLLSAAVAEDTFLAANSSALATNGPTVGNTGQLPGVSSTTRPEMTTPSSSLVEPKQADTSANQTSSRSTDQALSMESSIERSDEIHSVIQAESQTSATLPDTVTDQPFQRGISRRTVVVGLVGLAVVGVAGGGLALLTRSQQPTSIPTSAPASLSIGTTIYTYHGHSDLVSAVAWSSDGRRIASGSLDKTVQIWNAADGSHIYIYRGHSGGVNTMAWSPDGKRIASGGGNPDDTVQIWNAADGSHIYIYHGHSSDLSAVTWSPNSSRIASGSADGTVQVWDATGGGNVYTYRKHSSAINTVAWSPDGKRIASGSQDNTVQVWDATNGGNVYTYRGHSDYVRAVAWSPDGSRIASGSNDHTVQVWDATNGGNVYTYRGHSNQVYAVAWSPDGKHIASGAGDNTAQVWNATDGNNVFTYQGHSAGVDAVAWSSDGKDIASGSGDTTVQVWVAG